MSKQQAKTLVLLYCGIYLFLFPLIETGLIKLFDTSVIVSVLNVLEWGFYLTFPVIMVYVVWPWFRREFYLFCHDPFKNLIHILKNYGLMMISSILVNLILVLVFHLEQSGNQSSIIELYAQQPLKVMFAALVFAPIVEELVFRGSFYAPFRKNQRLLVYCFHHFCLGFCMSISLYLPATLWICFISSVMVCLAALCAESMIRPIHFSHVFCCTF